MSKKHCVVVSGNMVYGPCSKSEAKDASEVIFEMKINEKLEDWGLDPADCSEKRQYEAAYAVGMDGEMPEVMTVKAYKEQQEDYDEE